MPTFSRRTQVDVDPTASTRRRGPKAHPARQAALDTVCGPGRAREPRSMSDAREVPGCTHHSDTVSEPLCQALSGALG